MNNPYPKISIITPSYNQGQFIEQTILSVLGQQYPNVEYIIMDGGSTDNTVEIIKKYEHQISYWQSKKDGGQSIAINDGFKKSTGDILYWLNSDDMLMPGALFRMANYFLLNPNAIYFGNCLHFNEKSGGIYPYGSNVQERFFKYPLSLVDTIIQPSSFWSKSIWQKVGLLREDLHFGFDWEWFLRAERLNVAFVPIHDCLSLYRFHDSHKSGTGGEKRQIEITTIYEEYGKQYSELYKNLCSENFDTNRLLPRIVRKVRTHMKLDNSYGSLIKVFKRKKYEFYAVEDINIILSML